MIFHKKETEKIELVARPEMGWPCPTSHPGRSGRQQQRNHPPRPWKTGQSTIHNFDNEKWWETMDSSSLEGSAYLRLWRFVSANRMSLLELFAYFESLWPYSSMVSWMVQVSWSMCLKPLIRMVHSVEPITRCACYSILWVHFKTKQIFLLFYSC